MLSRVGGPRLGGRPARADISNEPVLRRAFALAINRYPCPWIVRMKPLGLAIRHRVRDVRT